jgi:hypothetical protein
MTWTSEGSVGDRLRALRVRDDILQKQEVDPAGIMTAGTTNMPTDQPGGLPAHMIGGGNNSAADAVWGELMTWLDDGNEIINRGERVSTTFAAANIDYDFIQERNGKFMKMKQMIDAFKTVVGRMMNEPEERQLRHHDPTQMANNQTNGNLAASTNGGMGMGMDMGMGGGM